MNMSKSSADTRLISLEKDFNCAPNGKVVDWNDYDAIELRGVEEFIDEYGDSFYEATDSKNPDFYSIYGHVAQGLGVECLHDFDSKDSIHKIREDVKHLASLLKKELFDYTDCSD